MNKIQLQEVWFVNFPFDDDPKKSKARPVVVLDKNDDGLEVLTIKVTSKPPHTDKDDIIDEYEVPIFDWEEANLLTPSVARISKMKILHEDKFITKIGKLSENDWRNINKKAKKYLKEITLQNEYEETEDRGR